MAVLIAKTQGNSRKQISENLRLLATSIETETDDNFLWDGFYEYDLFEGQMDDFVVDILTDKKYTKLL